MSDPAKTPSPLLVKNQETKQSETWGNTAKQRFIKQHGSVDGIPEGDAHAIPKYDDPTHVPPAHPDELKAAMSSLEDQIKSLQAKEKSEKT